MRLHIFLAIGLTFFVSVASAQPQPPGQALFQSKCASCHSAEGGGARDGRAQCACRPSASSMP